MHGVCAGSTSGPLNCNPISGMHLGGHHCFESQSSEQFGFHFDVCMGRRAQRIEALGYWGFTGLVFSLSAVGKI